MVFFKYCTGDCALFKSLKQPTQYKLHSFTDPSYIFLMKQCTAWHYNLGQLRMQEHCYRLHTESRIIHSDTCIAVSNRLLLWNPTAFNATSQPCSTPVVRGSYNSFLMPYARDRQLLSVLNAAVFIIFQNKRCIFFERARKREEDREYALSAFLAINLKKFTQFNSLNIFVAL